MSLLTLSVHRTAINAAVTTVCFMTTAVGLFALAHRCHRAEGIDTSKCLRPATLFVENPHMAWVVVAGLLILVSCTYCTSAVYHAKGKTHAKYWQGHMLYFTRAGVADCVGMIVFASALTVLAVVGAREIKKIPHDPNHVNAVCYICPDTNNNIYNAIVLIPL